MCHSERVNWISSSSLCRILGADVPSHTPLCSSSRSYRAAPPQLPLLCHIFSSSSCGRPTRGARIQRVYNLTECWVSSSPFTVTLTHTRCPSNTGVNHRWSPSWPGPRRIRLRAIEFANPPDYNERNRRYYPTKK